MSKRARSYASSEEPTAKRICVEAMVGPPEAGLTLLWLVEVPGLNKAFFDLLNPLEQRALCCINAATWPLLRDLRAPLPFCIPKFHDTLRINDVFEMYCGKHATFNYWRGQLGLAIHYDHLARIGDIVANDVYRYEQLNWAIAANARVCARHLAWTLPKEQSGFIKLNGASVSMIRALSSVGTVPLDLIPRHVLVQTDWESLVSLIEDPPHRFDLLGFMVTLRKILLRMHSTPFQRDRVLNALKPYGKHTIKHNPAPLLCLLKSWLSAEPPDD